MYETRKIYFNLIKLTDATMNPICHVYLLLISKADSTLNLIVVGGGGGLIDEVSVV